MITFKPKAAPADQSIPEDLSQLRLLNVQSAATLYGFSRPTFLKLAKQPGFPAPVKLPGVKQCWRLGELLDFQEQHRVNS